MLTTDSNALPKPQPVESSASPFEFQETTTALECPNCQTPYRVGELVCQQCGIVFSNAVRTKQLPEKELRNLERVRRVGGAIVAEMRPICLVVDGQKLHLPLTHAIIIGRQGNSANDPQPDVDLSQFNAIGRGVSRQHAKITRANDLTYVTDLSSMNGTFLNGFRLIPNQQRLLRDGDEIILGRLAVTVRF